MGLSFIYTTPLTVYRGQAFNLQTGRYTTSPEGETLWLLLYTLISYPQMSLERRKSECFVPNNRIILYQCPRVYAPR